MPRYYFNIHDDKNTIDEVGAELANPFAALGYAVMAARCLIQATVECGYVAVDHYVEILDAHRSLVEIVTFGDAIEIRHTNEVAPNHPEPAND